MIANITHKEKTFKVDLTQPIDISLPLKDGNDNPNAWYVPDVKMEAVVMGDWVGEIKKGGSVNFFNIFFNPHGHGTHTECVGHISKEKESINECVKTYFFTTQLISIEPTQQDGDLIITRAQIEQVIEPQTESIIIRTLPNGKDKKNKAYSNTNPPYLEKEAADLLRELDIKHLLIDLPSVDKEQDGGALAAHHAFWNYPNNTRMDCSITELIYVPSSITDGHYLLNLSFAPFHNDASPSRPTLYALL
ncbi:MAG: metal-dependent hydrolase [Flavobacteriales bacterium]|nr:metal-dependent hydrolase [Flavobacteriales bacterium]|tara:strand:+ start:1998 stop:2741 length:744 start_codon:yes stop_codon:yes gene_type:complete